MKANHRKLSAVGGRKRPEGNDHFGEKHHHRTPALTTATTATIVVNNPIAARNRRRASGGVLGCTSLICSKHTSHHGSTKARQPAARS
jgi:hypothetical protein